MMKRMRRPMPARVALLVPKIGMTIYMGEIAAVSNLAEDKGDQVGGGLLEVDHAEELEPAESFFGEVERDRSQKVREEVSSIDVCDKKEQTVPEIVAEDETGLHDHHGFLHHEAMEEPQGDVDPENDRKHVVDEPKIARHEVAIPDATAVYRTCNWCRRGRRKLAWRSRCRS